MSDADPNKLAWYCVRTQTKREHIAAEHLRGRDGVEVEVFCPRLRYRKPTRRGTIWWLEPLFPGYLMAKFRLAEADRTVTFCQGVSGLVRFGADVPEIPESFVESLRREYQADAGESEILTVSPDLKSGEEVEVANGPLAGMSGVVVEIAPAAERVKILLEFLGQPQVVDIDLFSILLPRKPLPPKPGM
ncbi:MAG: transcriptional activator RfaH [Verrucomicrobia bacterium]|nr:transcriptional activator RfaH [Verrucomicrobiota bacterium]